MSAPDINADRQAEQKAIDDRVHFLRQCAVRHADIIQRWRDGPQSSRNRTEVAAQFVADCGALFDAIEEATKKKASP